MRSYLPAPSCYGALSKALNIFNARSYTPGISSPKFKKTWREDSGRIYRPQSKLSVSLLESTPIPTTSAQSRLFKETSTPLPHSSGIWKKLFEFSQFRLTSYGYPAFRDFSLQTWKNIHFYLFQDIYEWAGELRTVKISKGRTMFAAPEFIESEASRLFQRLRMEKFLVGQDQGPFISRLAHYYGELNVLHPFRKGNGRSQKLLFELLALNAGFALG